MKIFSQWYATDIGKCLRKATAAVWQKTANTTRKPSKTAWHVSSPQAYARMDTQKTTLPPCHSHSASHIDHTDEQTKDIFVRACLLEYVLGAFISISGRGVKLFIRIDIDGVNDYPAIYEATAKLVSTVLGVENDGKCKDITHPCFGSYDPDAYYNGDAKAVNDFLPNGALTPRVTYAPVTSAPRTTCTPTSFSNGHPPAMPDNRISAAPFVQSYLTLYPAATGDRNGIRFPAQLRCLQTRHRP